jgi:hypothetical protein|tara:strand:+ start:655 stop:831 length:177 start_codon:yes stop_codon:yes gene_type:complete
MQLNISEEDIKNIIHAVKNCPTIEAHKREEILNPIREQLENHCVWNEYDEQKKVKRWV